MDISHIEHVGIAVPSLDEAIPFYENMLGLKCFAIEEVADQKVRTAFFRVGQTKIELLEPTAEDSAIHSQQRRTRRHTAHSFRCGGRCGQRTRRNRGKGRTPYRQGATQGSRGPQYRLHPPEVVGRYSRGTLRGSRKKVNRIQTL